MGRPTLVALPLRLSAEESPLLSEAQPVAQATGSRQPPRPGVCPASSGLAGPRSPEGLPREVSCWLVPGASDVPDAGPAPSLLLPEPSFPVSSPRSLHSRVAVPLAAAAGLSQPASARRTGRRGFAHCPGPPRRPGSPRSSPPAPPCIPRAAGSRLLGREIAFRSVPRPSGGSLTLAYQRQAAGMGIQ